ncbi:hypothetical protein TNIN_399871 [Trichonephila inaurata madagascariensis]|uniref:Uncharacterized protein n=1 Tax=Trichonephila inaurata madagascariensis TaxID=2747483 RepID=A0A8X6M9X6_9ARAC|nr:hypothetical protein TNIN_399871 [Trichonephila inaurata madagascariensis]
MVGFGYWMLSNSFSLYFCIVSQRKCGMSVLGKLFRSNWEYSKCFYPYDSRERIKFASICLKLHIELRNFMK